MAKILTYNSPKGIEENLPKDNIFKGLWEWFNSQEKYAKFFILTALLILIATPFVVNNLLETRQRAEAPPTVAKQGPEYVTDQYIVVLKDKDNNGNKIDSEVEAEDAVKVYGVQKKHVYKYALNGYSFHGSAQAAEALKQNPKVKYVVQDAKVHIDQTATPIPSDTQPPTAPTNLTANAIWSDTISLSWTASTDNVGVKYYYIFRNGVYKDFTLSPGYEDANVSPGTTYSYYVEASDAAHNISGPSNTATATTPPFVASTPYGGTPQAVPGKIEAENYDLGGEGVAYHEASSINTGLYRSDAIDIIQTPGTTGSDYTITNIQTDDRLLYTVNVKYTATYGISFNPIIAPGNSFVFYVDGVGQSGGIKLTAGQHVIEFRAIHQTTTSFDVNYLTLSAPLSVQQELPTGIERVGANVATGTTFAPTPSFSVAVIDTGIDLTHPDLNAVDGTNCIIPGSPEQDSMGHGTHVSGIIGATNNNFGVVGVAPGVKLVAVQVLDGSGSGTFAQVICGIDYVTANAATIKVANMSLAGFGQDDNNCGKTNNDPFHQAICSSVAAGVTYVVAAGNNNDDVAYWSPAAYNEVITTTALADYNGQSGGGAPQSCNTSTRNYGADDTFASFSNYATSWNQRHTVGAPGVCIISTYPTAPYGVDNAYFTLSGTSMASPHVAGAAAVYISLHPGINPSQVMAAIRGSGETLGNGHTDPSGLHPEPVLNLPALYNYPVPSGGGGISPTPSIVPITGILPGPSNLNVSLTQPSNGAVIPVGKTIVLTASATDDPGVNITKVEFYVNGVRKCSDTSSPYTCNFKVGTTVGAIYTITAKAYDITGNTKVSAPSNVTGGTDTVFPSVTLTTPLNGANVTVGTVVSITATAQDTVGISKVEFYVNGSRKCSDNSSPYSCNWTVSTGTGISYNLNARAYDYAGNISNSGIVVTSQ